MELEEASSRIANSARARDRLAGGYGRKPTMCYLGRVNARARVALPFTAKARGKLHPSQILDRLQAVDCQTTRVTCLTRVAALKVCARYADPCRTKPAEVTGILTDADLPRASWKLKLSSAGYQIPGTAKLPARERVSALPQQQPALTASQPPVSWPPSSSF